MTAPGTEYAIETLLPQFRAVGEQLAAAGLVSGADGNFSVWTPEGIVITREGADPGALSLADLCLVGRTTRPMPVNPSLDTPIHRVVYVLGGGRALIHAVPSAALALAATEHEIVPATAEGK